MESRSATSESSRKELERLYREFRLRKFPGSGGHQETDLLHTLMIQYEPEIGLGVKGMLEDPKSVDAFGIREDEEIQREVDRLVSTYPAEDEIGRIARNYADYYDNIKKLIHAARSYLESLNR